MVDDMQKLKECENSYVAGDLFFEEEHKKWKAFVVSLKKVGYTCDEVLIVREDYQKKIALVKEKEKETNAEVRLAKSMMCEINQEVKERAQIEMKESPIEEQSKNKQPIR
jgi:hypothetical protein